MPTGNDSAGKLVAAALVREVSGLLTTDETGKTIPVQPIRYVSAMATTDEIGRPTQALAVATAVGSASVDDLGRTLPVKPVRVVAGLTTTDEVGRTVPVRPVFAAGGCLVANRIGQPSRTVANGGAVTQAQEWHSVLLTAPARYLDITFGNFISNSSSLSQLDLGLAQLTLRMGVRRSTGTVAPGYLPGTTTRDMVLAPGDYGIFQVDLGAEYAVGTRLWLKVLGTYASAPANWAATDVIMSRGDEFNEFGNALTDRTLATSWSGGSRSTNYSVLSPVSVVARTANASALAVGIFGDSITAAGNNDGTFGDYIGWAQRGLAASASAVVMGAQGMTLGALIGSATQRTRRLTGMRLTHVLCTLGTNDLSGGTTDTQMLANLETFKGYLDPLGIKLIPATLPPRTNASNNAKYGPDSASVWARRISYNASIRSNNGVGYGYFDAAAHMQDGTSTDLWRTDLGTPTSDGIHPSTVVHTAVAAAFAAAIPTLFV